MKIQVLALFALALSVSAFAGPGSTGGGVSHFEFALNCTGSEAVTGSAFLDGRGVLQAPSLGSIPVETTAGYDSQGHLCQILLEGSSDHGVPVSLALFVPVGLSEGAHEFDAPANADVAGQIQSLRCHFTR